MELKTIKAAKSGSYYSLALDLLRDQQIGLEWSQAEKSARIKELAQALKDINDTQRPTYKKGDALTLPENFKSFYRDLTANGSTSLVQDTSINQRVSEFHSNAYDMSFTASGGTSHTTRSKQYSADIPDWRQKIIDAASQYVGLVETGRNRGAVDVFRRGALDASSTYGLAAPGSPYCTLMVGTALRDALGYNPLLGVAASREALSIAKHAGAYFNRSSYEPQPGDVAFFNRAGGGHLAIVKEVRPDGSIVLIEGNTRDAGVEGVHETILSQREASRRQLVGFINTETLLASQQLTNTNAVRLADARQDGARPVM